MKDLKFRVWNKTDKMFYNETSSLIYINIYSGNLMNIFNNTPIPMDNFVISQYIGLKDNNGKEIYEGDIITVGLEYCSTRTQLREVKYFQEISSFGILDNEDQYMNLPACPLYVVGNIYENLELIGESE